MRNIYFHYDISKTRREMVIFRHLLFFKLIAKIIHRFKAKQFIHVFLC